MEILHQLLIIRKWNYSIKSWLFTNNHFMCIFEKHLIWIVILPLFLRKECLNIDLIKMNCWNNARLHFVSSHSDSSKKVMGVDTKMRSATVIHLRRCHRIIQTKTLYLLPLLKKIILKFELTKYIAKNVCGYIS